MTLRQHPVSGTYELDVRDRTFGRVHLSLKTTNRKAATLRYAAAVALLREGDPELVFALRRQKLHIEAVERCARDRVPFSTLKAGQQWPTLGDAVARYTTWSEATGKQPNTLRAIRIYLGAAVEFFGAATPLDQITGARVAEFNQMQMTRPLKTDASRTLGHWSRAQYLIRLAGLFNWVRREEEKHAREGKRAPRLVHNPVDPELVPAPSAAKVRFLSEDEVALVMAATPPSLRWMVAAGILAGLRIGELLHLRPAPHDVDLERGLLFIQERAGDHPWRPKSGKSREIPIADELRPILEAQLARGASRHYVLPSPYAVDGAVPIGRDWVARELARVITAAGLVYGSDDPTGITYHTLRHTFASHLVMDGVDLTTVARLMGHASTRMVETTYGHLSPEHRRLAIGKLGTRLRPAFTLTPDETAL